MGTAPDSRPPLAAALAWVTKITTVAFEFFIPGLIGQWCDQRLGTRFLGLAGLAFGMVFGLWHLLRMARADGTRKRL